LCLHAQRPGVDAGGECEHSYERHDSGLKAPCDIGDTRAELLAFIEPVVTVPQSPLINVIAPLSARHDH
jgi:hypothetical protein